MMRKNTSNLSMRIIAILMCALLLISSTDISTLAAAAWDGGKLLPPAGDDTGLCEHHPVHTEECGYIEALGHICTHEHDAACGYNPGSEEIPCDHECANLDEEGNIIHVEECAYAPAVEPSPCTHEHNRACGFVPASPCTHKHGVNCGYAEGEPCVHVHDEACGYVESVEGTPCTHEHDETCGYSKGAPCVHEHNEVCGYVQAVEGVSCQHAHNASCGYAPAVAGQPCQHVHDGACGYFEGASEIPCNLGCVDVNEDGIVDHEEGCAYTPAVAPSPCNHVAHDGTCGYVEAVAEQPCNHIAHDETCGYVEAVEGHACGHNHDDACGYVAETPCTHTHDETCGYTEGVEGTDCSHEHDDACGYVEDVPCIHVHDANCGYVDPVAGQPCQFICQICALIVTDWVWVDTDGNLQPGTNFGLEDVSWVLEAPEGEEDLAALLPAAITAAMKSGDIFELPITWNLDNKVEYELPAVETESGEDEYTPEAAAIDDTESAVEDSSDQHAEEVQSAFYLLTAELPAGYGMDADAPAMTVLVYLHIDSAYTVADWAWVDPDENLIPGTEYGMEDVDWLLDATGVSDEDVPSLLPAAITATVKSGDCIELPVTWNLENKIEYEASAAEAKDAEAAEDAEATESVAVAEDAEVVEDETDDGEEFPEEPVKETVRAVSYLLTAELPEGYALDEDAPELKVLVCQNWGRIVVSWEWVDPYEILLPGTEYGLEDYGWVFGVPFGANAEQLAEILPASIEATLMNGETIEIPITWDFENMQPVVIPTEWLYDEDEEDGTEDEAPSLDGFSTGDETTKVGSSDVIEISEADVPLAGDLDPSAGDAGASNAPSADDGASNEPAIENGFAFGTAFAVPEGYTAVETPALYLIPALLPEEYQLDEGVASLEALMQTMDISLLWNLADIPVYELPEAMHFIVRHWHTDETTGEFDKGEESGDWYFIVAEGYIVPASDGVGYQFFMVDQGSTQETEATYEDAAAIFILDTEGNTKVLPDLVEIKEGSEAIAKSPYIVRVNKKEGSITLTTNGGIENESFVGYSVSAGHKEATINGDNTITIKYDPGTHLVKAHAFYKDTAVYEKDGVDFRTIFRDDELSDERDTAEIDMQNNEILTEDAEDENEDENDEEQDEDSGEGKDLTKVYDTSEGLHTDKTATENGSDGRTFDLELEAWYAEGHSPLVGMILDASGSMAFASDRPEVIKYNEVVSLNATQKAIFAQYKALIEDKDSAFTNTFKLKEDDRLKGYYEFYNAAISNDSKAHRTWFLNTVKGGDPKGYTTTADYENADYSWFAKTVAQTASDVIDFTNGTPIKKLEDFGISGATGWGDVPANFSATNGMGLDHPNHKSAFKLDVTPNNNEFTISFSLEQTNTSASKEIEILYIGSETGDRSAKNYFHVYRKDDNINVVMGNDANDFLFTFPDVYAANGKHTFTFAFRENSVTAYLDGVYQGSKENIALGGKTIVFSPFPYTLNDSSANGRKAEAYFFLDNIYVYDGVALLGCDVNMLIANSGSTLDTQVTVENFLEQGELTMLMDPRNTDNSALGYAGYSYFVYDPRKTDTSMEYAPLGYYSSRATTLTDKNINVDGEGWYFVSCSGWYGDGTSKKMQGLGGTASSFVDTITNNTNIGSSDSGGAAPHVSSGAGSGKTYTLTQSQSATKFYIDQSGYLRCFFMPTNNYYLTSYVYELADSAYIRTESLQRAVGAFMAKLDQETDSPVSAAKFSQTNVSGMTSADLVLLDWTDDISSAINFMSATAETSGKQRHKYALTGGTNIKEGLKAFIDELQKNGQDNFYKLEDPNEAAAVPKYLILFTDGKDAEVGKSNSDSLKSANDLKSKGYTIFSVLLEGNTLLETGDYETVKDFLVSLSGKQTYKNDDNAENYFYSVSKAIADDPSLKGTNDADILTSIFSEEILAKIVDDLKNYVVQDYIDPRFDLVDRSGGVWHLNAGGNVKIVGGDNDGQTCKIDAKPKYKLPITGDDDEGDDPYLLYNADKDLYYLQWRGQKIPSCTVGASRLSVWNATVTIRAKDDFIGGNAVLTNGIYANQNYVYNESDPYKSSGTDNAAKKNDKGYVSKGFPRVSVNVTPPYEDVELAQTIYMGERLNKDEIASKIIITAKDQAKNGAELYWEYVSRFVDYFNWLIDNGDLNDPDGVIKRLHKINRRGEIVDSSVENPFETGHIALISSRILGLMEDGELSVEKLSELLITVDTTIEDDGSVKAENGKYLYLPYIYLPDDPEEQKNSTGKAIQLEDVIGYLYFHVKEQDVDNSPKYPDDGVTRDTDTRRSRLTVSFVVHSPEDRATWNNGMVIQEKNSAGNTIYARNTVHKPAAGEARDDTDPVVVMGTFTTFIHSGQIMLQIRLTADQAEALAKYAAGSIEYEAQLIRSYPEGGVRDQVIGTLTISGSPAEIMKKFGDEYLITTKFTPQETYMDYDDGYGLPIGTYSLKVTKDLKVPVGYAVKKYTAIGDGDDKNNRYNDRDLFEKGYEEPKPIQSAGGTPAEPETDALMAIALSEPGADVPVGIEENDGEGGESDTPETPGGTSGIIAYNEDQTFILGYNEQDKVKAYTDYRIGLFEVDLVEVGDLEITKTVESIASGCTTHDAAKDTFKFTVSLKKDGKPYDASDVSNEFDYVINPGKVGATTGKITFNKNGVSSPIYLKHGQNVIIKNLPVNAYTVAEASDNRYVTSVLPSDNGTISQKKSNDFDEDKENRKVANYTNTPVHSLTVEKTVLGNDGETNRDWEFTVTLTLPAGSEVPAGFTQVDGQPDVYTRTFTLRHGQSSSVMNLPCGTTYRVTETGANGPKENGLGPNYTTIVAGADDDTGAVASGTLNRKTTITYTNSNPQTEVTISKTVENLAQKPADADIDFKFVVMLTVPAGSEINDDYPVYYMIVKNGVNGEQKVLDVSKMNSPANTYMGTVALRHGETARIIGMPGGTKVTMYEVADARFKTTYDGVANQTQAGPKDVVANAAAPTSFEVTNERIMYGLTLYKTVTGNMGDRKKAFTFTVHLNDGTTGEALTGTYEYTGDKEGTIGDGGTITLASGESVTIGLPVGTKYTITESDADGYDTYINSEFSDTRVYSDKLTDDFTLEYRNDREAPVPTGVGLEMGWLLALMALAGCLAGVIFMRRRER